MVTLEGVEDCEDVVGRDPEDAVGEEGETPCDTQHAAQSQDGYNAFATSANLCIGSVAPLETEEPGQHDDEGDEGEEEDQRVVAYVDNVVDGTVCYPAPLNTHKNAPVKGKEAWLCGVVVKYVIHRLQENFSAHMATFSSLSFVRMTCSPYFPMMSRTTPTTLGSTASGDRKPLNCK